MPSNQLYTAAFSFKNARLWEKLQDSEMFAVRHSDGTIGYCSVMGMMKQHFALAVYPGVEGLDSIRQLTKDRWDLKPFEELEIALSQNCLMCSFAGKDEMRPRELAEAKRYCTQNKIPLRGKAAYPKFERFRPHYFPWYIDDAADELHLLEALEAAVEVAERLDSASSEALGFVAYADAGLQIPMLVRQDTAYKWEMTVLPKPLPVRHPTYEVQDDVLLNKLKKQQKHSGEWICDICLHSQALTEEECGDEEPKNAPVYPYLTLLVDKQNGLILHTDIEVNLEACGTKLARVLLETALKAGIPTKVLVCNARTKAAVKWACEQMGIKPTQKKRIPVLDEIKMDMLEHFNQQEGAEDAMIDQAIEMLKMPEVLPALPDDMLGELIQMGASGCFPEDIAKRLIAEMKRRKR